MKKLFGLLILGWALILFNSSQAVAQEYDEWLKQQQKEQNDAMNQMQKDFSDFIEAERKAFDNYIKEMDKEFSNYLKGKWDPYKVAVPEKQKDNPGPKTLPTFDPKIVKKEIKGVPVSKKDVDMNPRQVTTLGVPILPDEEVLEKVDYARIEGGVTFYGLNESFYYDQNMAKAISGSVSENNISKFWDDLAATKYFPLLDNLLNMKTRMSLNDWGYYMLLKKVSEQIIPNSPASSNLLTWFLLVKSNYKVKVGYTQNNVYLLLPTQNTIYGMSYFTYNGLAYYAPGLKGESIYTYKKDFPDSRLIMDLNINNPLNLGSEVAERKVEFEWDNKKYNLKMKYNKNLIDFYNDYPQCEIGIFFNAAVSRIAKESIAEQLLPLVSGKKEIDAVNLLLNFVQTGFKYQTDQEQFNREKFFFAEEVFHYPYADCEDRSVLFSYLVRELLKLDVVGLNYPGHISTAVKFTEKVDGDYFDINTKKYVMSDPTYINAPVGMTMPDYKAVKPVIVAIDNLQNKENLKREMWDKLYAMGGNRGDNGQDIVFDDAGNCIVTGYFMGEVMFGSFKLSTAKDSKDIFIAKLDKKGSVVWAQQAKGKGNEMAYSLATDKTGNVVITGSYDSQVTFGTKTLKTNGTPDIFVSKYDKNGTFLWASSLGLDTSSAKMPNRVFMADFSAAGKLINKKMFNETEYFDKYGILIDSTGNAHVTGALASAMSMGGSKDVVTNSAAQLNFAESWAMQSSKLIEGNYSPEVIGLFAFINSIRMVGAKVEGKSIQEALDKSNPTFKETAPQIYKSLGNMSMIKNSSGIVSISTGENNVINLGQIKIDNNSKVKFVTYEDGNSRINILNGIYLGKGIVKYNLNFIKIFKDNGDLLLDYDADNAQKRINMKKDLME